MLRCAVRMRHRSTNTPARGNYSGRTELSERPQLFIWFARCFALGGSNSSSSCSSSISWPARVFYSTESRVDPIRSGSFTVVVTQPFSIRLISFHQPTSRNQQHHLFFSTQHNRLSSSSPLKKRQPKSETAKESSSRKHTNTQRVAAIRKKEEPIICCSPASGESICSRAQSEQVQVKLSQN